MQSGSGMSPAEAGGGSSGTVMSFLLDIFVDTIETFVGKSTPSLAVAAGRKMAKNIAAAAPDQSAEASLAEMVALFNAQKMNIRGEFVSEQAVFEVDHCPIRDVCLERNLDLDGQLCQMFHYYLSGFMAERVGCSVRPTTVAAGEQCTFNMAFSRLPK